MLIRPNVATISRIMALVALGRLRARRGDPEVWVVLDEALDLATQTATLQRLAPVRAARAEAAWLANDPDKTREEARTAYDLARSHAHPWFMGEHVSAILAKLGVHNRTEAVREALRLGILDETRGSEDAT